MKAHIAAAGGVEAVLRAMEAHAEAATVLEKACFVLAALAFENSPIQGAIVAAGGLVAVVRALGTHSAEVKVQEWGLRALYNLANNHPTNQAAVVARGGAQLARTAQQTHLSGSHDSAQHVQRYAKELLLLLGAQ